MGSVALVLRFSEDDFEPLEDEIDTCLDNIQAEMDVARHFYEEAAGHLRAHAILRLLIDADTEGFASDLVLSGYSRRAFLKRCAREKHDDYFRAFSRSESMIDVIAAGHLALAGEILALSPTEFRKGDEYADDFHWQRVLGLLATGSPKAKVEVELARLEAATEGEGARLAIARAFQLRDAGAFQEAFEDLLRERTERNEEDAGQAEEDIAIALGTKVYVEGIAVLVLARHAGLPIAAEYPMCPTLALLPHPVPEPQDDFGAP